MPVGDFRLQWIHFTPKLLKALIPTWEVNQRNEGKSLGKYQFLQSLLEFKISAYLLEEYRGAWQATVHGIMKNWTWLSNYHELFAWLSLLCFCSSLFAPSWFFSLLSSSFNSHPLLSLIFIIMINLCLMSIYYAPETVVSVCMHSPNLSLMITLRGRHSCYPSVEMRLKELKLLKTTAASSAKMFWLQVFKTRILFPFLSVSSFALKF